MLYSLDQVLDYGKMMNIPQADERNRKTVRNEVPLFNEKAFEEAVINAFVHNRWIDGNAPMFTGFRDRIEILSRGNLPPKQTFEGFFAGESVPVNKALSDIFIKLHITEHTGRGIPRITNVYGRESIKFNENSIMVTIPYERLGSDIYGIIDKQVNAQVDAQVDAQVNAQVDFENDEDKIMSFCETAKSMVELMEFLGVKDRRTVRKILNPMIAQGRIARTIPDKPNSRLQKYIAIK
ncbi:MAG: hypothetical protein K5656_07660 [Lachnospiraceae bacterium]|nr:hypothetical protein [Lachnospiraceae bacterium]